MLSVSARRGGPARRTGILAILIAVAFGLVGCVESTSDGGDRSGSGSEGGKPAPTKSYRIAVIPKGTTHVFWKSIHAGALLGAKELEETKGIRVEIRWQGPLREDERDGQRQVIESFITQNVDGIVLAPLDQHAMVGPVKQAQRNGKPVVIIDSGLDYDGYVSFVATDNYKGGVLGARELGKRLGGKGKVLLLRYMVGSASTTNREKGFIDTMKQDFPEIELVPPGLKEYAGATAAKAQEAAEILLTSYGDIDGVFCPNESSVVGMLEALKRAGRPGEVTFIGFDANDKLVQALREDRIQGLVLQDPVRMAAMGVKTMIAHLENEKIEKRIDTGVYVATRANMESPEIYRLLHPDLSILGD